MNRDQDQLSQLVRYASLCDILAGCSQFADLVSVCDYITKKLKYVINGYAWTYHAVREGGVQIVARKSKRLSVTKEPLDELMAHREFCRGVSTMVAVDLDESKGDAVHLCEPLVIERLRQVLIVPIRRNDEIEAYVAYYAKDQCFDDLDKKFIVLVSEFVHDKVASIETRGKLEASLLELAEKKRYSSYRNISLAMAHHVNTPLSVSVNCNALIDAKVDDLDSLMRNKKLSARALSDGLSEISELQGLAGENLNRLSTLINGFREACVHVEDQTSSVFALNDAIQRTLAQVKTSATVDVNGDEEVWLSGHQDSLVAVFVELIENALNHGFDGSIDEPRVTLDIRCMDALVSIHVRDNGVGIQDEHRARVFEPFFSGDGMAKGQGLGLYNVYNLVSNVFSGQIRCEASEQGAYFVLILPRAEKNA
ncbi:MAG: sensor histidine kinase [Bradymonadia bacterium]